MACVIEQNSEGGFVFESVLEFLQCWELGTDSRMILETYNGRAWMNFSCCMGRPFNAPKRIKSKARETKDNLRASVYQAKTPEKIETSDDEPDCQDDVVYKGDTVKCVIGGQTQDNCCMDEKQFDMLREDYEKGLIEYLKENHEDIEVHKVEHTGKSWTRKMDVGKAVELEFKIKYRQKNNGSNEDFKTVIEKLAKENQKFRVSLYNEAHDNSKYGGAKCPTKECDLDENTVILEEAKFVQIK